MRKFSIFLISILLPINVFAINNTGINKILENANYEIDSQTIEKIYDENDKMLKWKVRSVVHEKDSDSYFVSVYYENL